MRTAQATMEESKYKYTWEQARFIAYYAAAGNLKKGTSMRSLITFPWEYAQVDWDEKIAEIKADKRFKKHLN